MFNNCMVAQHVDPNSWGKWRMDIHLHTVLMHVITLTCTNCMQQFMGLISQRMDIITGGPCQLFSPITPINNSSYCKIKSLQRLYSNITISWFDFLHLLLSFIYLRLSKWMSRDIHFRERQAWSSGICPICPVISWRDAHWATAVDTSWSLKNYLTLLLLCTLGTFGKKSKH